MDGQLNSSQGKIKFNVDIKNEKRKMIILRNKLNNKLFHINEEMAGIYQRNIQL